MPLFENHTYENPALPIIFHLDTVNASFSTPVHWHENIELLFAVRGSAEVVINRRRLTMTQGDLIVINSGSLHAVEYSGAPCDYYCLIVQKSLYEIVEQRGSIVSFCPLIQDVEAADYFRLLIRELENRDSFYEDAVSRLIVLLFLTLYRKHRLPETNLSLNPSSGKKISTVKSAIALIRKHFAEPLTTAVICSKLGFSKSYFCHLFKEVTGYTVVDYLNYVRCSHAKKLIRSGVYNISEAAAMSGFNTLSYFSKTYRRHYGCSPSDECR